MFGKPPLISIVDDDASVRRGLSRLISSAGMDVEVFSSAESFLAHSHEDREGCLLLDVRMPVLDGLALHRSLDQCRYFRPVIFMSGHGDVPMSVEAMKQGAVDFLTKPVDGDRLLKAIRNALELDAIASKKRALRIKLRKRLDMLTDRELEVLRYVITGMLNKQIAFELGISEKTIKVHRSRVMEKLRVDSVAELVRAATIMDIQPQHFKQFE